MKKTQLDNAVMNNARKPDTSVVKNNDKTSSAYWAPVINATLQRSVSLLIEAGKQLLEAKEHLRKHGEWQRLFEEGLIKIHLREAERLMQIAKNGVLSNTNNCSLLPPSPQALAALSKADPRSVQEGISNTTIHPRMTIKEAKRFLATHPGPQGQPKRIPRGFDKEQSSQLCHDALCAELKKWPEGDYSSFLALLKEFVLELEAHIMKEEGQTQAKDIPAAGATDDGAGDASAGLS